MGRPDANYSPDAALPTAPSTRPELGAPGQAVPLLYGRSAGAIDRRDASANTVRIPLGDPSDLHHQAFFIALDQACVGDLDHAIRVLATPAADCGAGALYEGHLALCRARAAVAFAAEQPRASLAGKDIRLELGNANPPDALWSVTSAALSDRASWAMYAVSQHRHAIATMARALDSEYCPDGVEDPEALVLAAEGLREAQGALESSTALADNLLKQRLIERYGDEEDSPALRTEATRGLTESSLERLKLYLGVPYGAFTPVEGEEAGVDTAGRYPVLHAIPSEEVADAAVMLAALRVDLFDETGTARTGDALQDAWFAALRRSQPLVFGSLGTTEVDRALEQLSLSLEELEAAAAWLRDSLLTTGTPAVHWSLPGDDSRVFETVAHVDVAGPSGYVAGMTEARAELEADAYAYATRGLAHAREYSARVARAMLADDTLDERARAAFSAIAESSGTTSGRAELCRAKGADATLRLSISPSGDAAAASARYQLYRGEADVACALAGTLFDRPCQAAGRALLGHLEAAEHTLVFSVPEEPEGSPRLYLVEQTRDAQGVEQPRVVGTFALDPFEGASTESCATTPLDAALHETVARLHGEDVGVVPRSISLPRGGRRYALERDTPVPLLWGQTLLVRTPEGGEKSIDLAQPFDSTRLLLERAILAECPLEPLQGTNVDGELCDGAPYAYLRDLSCLIAALRGETIEFGGHVLAQDAESDWARELWAYDSQHRLVVAAAAAIEHFECRATGVQAARNTPELELQLWRLAKQAGEELLVAQATLRTKFDQRIAQRWADELDPQVAAVGSGRALQDSRLAAARLLVAVPLGLYEQDATSVEVEASPYERFPVLAHRASTAEDTRIEALLRMSQLHPLMPDLTVVQGALDVAEFDDQLSKGALALRLRTELVALDAERYGATPTTVSDFLQALGISRSEHERAARRIVELSEARGLSLLPVRGSNPPFSSGLDGAYPAAEPLHLYALTEGRAHFAADALPTSFAARGPFHALASLEHAMRVRLGSGDGLSEREETLAWVSDHARGPVAAFHLGQEAGNAQAPVVEIASLQSLSLPQVLATYELWWTDSGLECALRGVLDGAPCDENDFRFTTTVVQLKPATAPGLQGVQLEGLDFPLPSSWDPELSTQRRQGRVYLTQKSTGERRVIAATSLELKRAVAEMRTVPNSPALFSALSELLAYREPPEGCGTCRPRSVCESTSCADGVCVRTALDEIACGLEATCVAGECSEPGCGDGVRSSGADGVPFEACDDGNLEAGDGCSATCSVEQRELAADDPEVWPAGPAPALGVDGLGRVLVVYTLDPMVGESVQLRAAGLDAFGVLQAEDISIAARLPRGYAAEPNVAGLAGGGFVVVYASPEAAGSSRAVYRIIDAEGGISAARDVFSGGSAQSGARVASIGDGFAVVWSQRDAGNNRGRLMLRRFDASGEPLAEPVMVAGAVASAAQDRPSMASSQGQLLIAWAELDLTTEARSMVRGRRFTLAGAPADAAAFTVAHEHSGEPSVSALGSGDFVVAWTSRAFDTRGDVWARRVNRFGAPLQSSEPLEIAASAEIERQPAIAGATDDFLVVYQRELPLATATLHAPFLDPDTAALAQTALSASDQADVSAISTSHGIWLVWSQRLAQRRALKVLLLPSQSPAALGLPELTFGLEP